MHAELGVSAPSGEFNEKAYPMKPPLVLVLQQSRDNTGGWGVGGSHRARPRIFTNAPTVKIDTRT
jgi:hypothetical protein